MAIANLHETLLAYTMRKNAINLNITNLQSQKALALLQTQNTNSLLAAGKAELRDYYKDLFENDEELQEKYDSYTEIVDFEEAIEKIQAQYNDELAEIAAWETQVDSEITTESAELEEINAYMESMKNMLSSNIQEDFKFGLN